MTPLQIAEQMDGDIGEAIVRSCLAVSCQHNDDGSCTLDHVSVNSTGKCMQFAAGGDSGADYAASAIPPDAQHWSVNTWDPKGGGY